jgi:hypothetical protein
MDHIFLHYNVHDTLTIKIITSSNSDPLIKPIKKRHMKPIDNSTNLLNACSIPKLFYHKLEPSNVFTLKKLAISSN